MSLIGPRLSNAQIDKLGDRLRTGAASSDELMLLALFRSSFDSAYQRVIDVLRKDLGLTVTGRPGKTTQSIVAKLQRQRVRLSQMQDIAGCRVVVDHVSDQDEALGRLLGRFPEAIVDDRRGHPSFGYRAVHLIVPIAGRVVEIQLRTRLQHLWAEMSEAIASALWPNFKYGDDLPQSPGFRERMLSLSRAIASKETPDVAKADIMSVLPEIEALARQIIVELETIRTQ